MIFGWRNDCRGDGHLGSSESLLAGHADLLETFWDRVLAPVEVRSEFIFLAESDQRFAGLVFPDFIGVETIDATHEELLQKHRLDRGEIAALSLALERGIREVLIDERIGRRVAERCGLSPSGLLGVLVKAKRRAIIPEVLSLLDRLHSGARFWISPGLRSQVANSTGESP